MSDINTKGHTPADLCILRIKSSLNILSLTGHLEDRLGKSLDIVRGDTGNGDTAILGGVDGVLETNISDWCLRKATVLIIATYLLGKSVHLLGLETSVGKHTNLWQGELVSANIFIRRAPYLAGDVGPVVLAAQLLQVFPEQGAHLNDAVGHALDLSQPLLVELRVVHDGGGNTGTVDRGVRVEGADENLDLRVHTLLLFGVLTHKGESTDTLTIETL